MKPQIAPAMKTIKLLALSFLLLASCEAKRNASPQTLPGAYVREFTTEVQHPETGEILGRSTFRDTIYIQAKDAGYEIRHTKWRLNDFDAKGWQNQQHTDNRPMSVFQATFNPADSSLQPGLSEGKRLVFVVSQSIMLYLDNNRKKGFQKVK
jgi:hypothetical protein